MAYWVDDKFGTWPEVFRAGTAAAGLYVRCGAYCAANTTDGHIPLEVATGWGTREWIQKLVEVGLWEIEETGYRDVYYLVAPDGSRLNPTAEEAKKKRAQAAKRQALVRDPDLREAIRLRDRDFCRYCAVKVRWKDRKGSAGGTYDHVDPFGPNTYENLVVACRGCNSSKRDRTPEQAGMVLRPVPGSGSYLDTTQNEPGTDLVSSHPPSLPPSREGKGGKEVEGGEDLKPVDWRRQPAFGAPRDPNEAARTAQRAAELRATLPSRRRSASPEPPPFERLVALLPDPPPEQESAA